MESLHVQAPTAIVLICGGQTSSVAGTVPLSLRDAFLKIADNPVFNERSFIQIEDTPAFDIFTQNYEDLLQFETDLAQIVELIILFCESEGSLAELGAFSMVSEIAARLFVIVRNHHWKSKSFISLGPLKSLQNRHGRGSIYVVDDDDLGIVANSASGVDKSVLNERLSPPIEARLAVVREPTTFDRSRHGHVIKLIVGLIQEYGALLLNELEDLMLYYLVDRTSGQLNAFLLCAETVGWITKISKGQSDYYCACNLIGGIDAAILVSMATAKEKNRDRRRMLIREHWRKFDTQRDRAIRQALTGAHK